jgi:hypothetical protein
VDDNHETLPEITENERGNIVDAALRLISALKMAYGPNKASEVFCKIDTCLGEATGLALLRIMCGDNLQVTLNWTGTALNKINVIRAIRASQTEYVQHIDGSRAEHYKFGLKDAKDIVDDWFYKTYPNCNFSVSWECSSQENLTSFKQWLKDETNLHIC